MNLGPCTYRKESAVIQKWVTGGPTAWLAEVFHQHDFRGIHTRYQEWGFNSRTPTTTCTLARIPGLFGQAQTMSRGHIV